VTNNPIAEWIAGQVTDAFPWDEAPRHLIRDRDGAFGPASTRIHAMESEITLSTAVAVPERPRRTAHRIDPSRISLPLHRFPRSPLARCPEGLRLILQ
jgi:hypothetical protein